MDNLNFDPEAELVKQHQEAQLELCKAKGRVLNLLGDVLEAAKPGIEIVGNLFLTKLRDEIKSGS